MLIPLDYFAKRKPLDDMHREWERTTRIAELCGMVSIISFRVVLEIVEARVLGVPLNQLLESFGLK